MTLVTSTGAGKMAPGGLWTPASLPPEMQTASWVEASSVRGLGNNSPIPYLPDLSGNSIDAYQHTAGIQPTVYIDSDGVTWFRLNGAGDFFYLGNHTTGTPIKGNTNILGNTPTQQGWVFVRVKPQALTSYGTVLGFGGLNGVGGGPALARLGTESNYGCACPYRTDPNNLVTVDQGEDAVIGMVWWDFGYTGGGHNGGVMMYKNGQAVPYITGESVEAFGSIYDGCIGTHGAEKAAGGTGLYDQSDVAGILLGTGLMAGTPYPQLIMSWLAAKGD